MTAHLLLVAKAPVAGQVKTRLGARIGMERAAALASAALLDTVEVAAAAFPGRCHLALDGDLGAAVDGAALVLATSDWHVFAQEGESFAARLEHAHARVAAPEGEVVVQIGMDTPQVGASLLAEVARAVDAPDVAALGPAPDGGWWVLGSRVRTVGAAFRGVPMSTPETGVATAAALEAAGYRVVAVPVLTDVDTLADAAEVAATAPGSRFAAAWRRVCEERAS